MIDEFLEMLLNPAIEGITRRKDLDYYYFKIGLIKNNFHIRNTADYLGYSEKAVRNRIAENRKLKALVGDDVNISRNSPLYEQLFTKGKICSVKDLCDKRIQDTKRKFWFRCASEEEQKQVIRNIINLYSEGDPC